MATTPPPGAGFGRRFEEALERIEKEAQQAVDFMNDAVVPKVRQESITAMRKVADRLRALADRLERASKTDRDSRP